VSSASLAAYLRLDSADDPTLTGTLIVATQLVTDYLNLSLLRRAFNLVYSFWPMQGSAAYGLSGRENAPAASVMLPYAAFETVTVERVSLYAEDTADFRVLSTAPAAVEFIGGVYTGGAGDDEDAILIEYTAGFEPTGNSGTDDNGVPEPIKQAILMIAAYLFAHRGACDTGNAITASGASVLLYPFRQSPVVL
jgi:uncharacterized phiE125 gp8 family phage protein